MGNHTLSTLSIKTCTHGVPVSIKCSMCEREAAIAALPDDHPKCKHGKPEGFCPDCASEKEYAERELKVKAEEDSLREYKFNNPEPSLHAFNVPRKYVNCSLDTFRGNDKLVEGCREYRGGGVVLYGNTGCGKTHIAVSLMRETVKTSDKKQWFETVPDLLLRIRSSFRDKASETEEEIVDRYATVPLLVLDDLGSEKATEFAITTLYIILDRRDREMLDTVITTNLSLAEIGEKLSARIASRLSGMTNIKINMPDNRKKRGS